MASSSRRSLDGAHCLWPLCSHTCCWEAERRINEGHRPKMTTFNLRRTSAAAAEDDRLPVITVVDASRWSDARSAIEPLSLNSEDDFSELSNNFLITPVGLPRRARRREDVQINSSSSDMSTQLGMSRGNTTIKLKTVHISPLSSDTSVSSKPVFTWMSSSCCVPPKDSQHSAKPPRLAVKELIFPPSAEVNTPAENKNELRQEKSGGRISLKKTLKCTLNQEGKGSLMWEAGADLSDPGPSWRGSDSDLQVKKASALPQVHRLVPVGQTLAAAPEAKDEQQPPRSAQALLPGTEPTISERVRERMQGRHTQERHRMSKYKRDLKTGSDLLDWESLRTQTYLWRTHTEPFNSECGKPPPLEDKSDYVPYSLHPNPIRSSFCSHR